MSKNKIIAIIGSVLVALGSLLSVYVIYQNTGEIDTNKVQEAISTVVKEVTISEEAKEIIIDTKNATEDGEDISTTETIENTIPEEEVVDEGAIEPDAQVDQENISYDGDITGNGQALLGAYQGVTYYSQADSRWADLPYTSTGNPTQTMKSSSCGATSAAMVVSSSKGAILPTTMANLFVDNGYRTANNGTAWSAYSFVADYFGFNDYHTTDNLSEVLNYLGRDDNNDGISDYFVIASCGSGLFTTGGHYIVLEDLNGATITVWDPYLYNGKFDTASRRGKVTVSGNDVYCSVSNFENYANYKHFWIYSNDGGNGNNYVPVQPKTSEYGAGSYEVTASALRVRVQPNTNCRIVTTLSRGSKQGIDYTQGNWGHLMNNAGWICLDYCRSYVPITNSTQNTVSNVIQYSTGYKTGTYKTTANLHVRTGASTKYRAKTYKELTANARKQNKQHGNYYYNGYKKGVICTVTKVKGNWGLTKSGWVCLDYCRKQ